MSSDKGTIRIPRDTFKEHNQRRKDLGVTWEEYINGQAPERAGVDVDELAESVANEVSVSMEVDHDSLIDTEKMAEVVAEHKAELDANTDGELGETLEAIREGLSTVEERTGRVERTLEDMGAHR